MAQCRIFEVEGGTLAQYDEVSGKFPDHPEGCRIHASGFSDGKLVVVEIWDSPEAADEYMSSGIGEAIGAAGITEENTKATIFEVHNMTEPAKPADR
jgi:hypothetical protein